ASVQSPHCGWSCGVLQDQLPTRVQRYKLPLQQRPAPGVVLGDDPFDLGYIVSLNIVPKNKLRSFDPMSTATADGDEPGVPHGLDDIGDARVDSDAPVATRPRRFRQHHLRYRADAEVIGAAVSHGWPPQSCH